MIKKKWVRPQLIALVKGRFEESVLENCKGGGISGPNVPMDVDCGLDASSCGCTTKVYT
jgi:hypothetical protein